MAAILWEDAEPRRLLSWVGLVFAMLLCRGAVFHLYFRRNPQGLDRLKWERPFVFALFASALVWSIGLTGVAYEMSLESRLFAYFFLMGMAAGAISVFIALRYAAIATVSIMLIPMSIVFLSSGRTPEIITAIAACTAIISTISGTKILGNNLLRIFSLTHELADKTEKLQNAHRAAEHAKNTRGQFVASVSHEIRTPLNVILGMIEMIREEPLSTTLARYVRSLETAGSHLKTLVDNVLDFVKIDENQMELHESQSNIIDIVHKITEAFESDADKKGMDFLLEYQGLSQPYWNVDQQRMQQILFNVVGNALKFSERGTITIKLRDDVNKSGIVIVVADQGMGIHANKLEQIFEPYIQGQDRQLDELPSTGLGLTITKKLVDLMGGRIDVKSRLGVGSVFKIYLPLIPSPETSEEIQLQEHRDTTYSELKGKKVLVAEDAPLAKELIRDYLDNSGVLLRFAGSGVEALDVLRTTSVDLILLDLQMAPKGGIETTMKIRRFESNNGSQRCPIIIQSADNRIESVDASLAAGADYFLPKPFSRGQLLKVINQLLRPSAPPLKGEELQLDAAVARLMPRFISETKDLLNAVQIALSAGDFLTAAEEIHKIKGYCGMFQQTELYQLVEDWEQFCLHENLPEAETQQRKFLTYFQKVSAKVGVN